MSKFNFNIDIEDTNELLNKSSNKSISQKQMLELDKYTVDLGLPSGTRWCKYNLGVDINRLDRYIRWYGDYYAWGELTPKSNYIKANYTFRKNNFDELTKYCNSASHGYNKFVDNLTQLQLEDDAAYQNLHIENWKFKIPTKEQYEELIEYTTNEWVDSYKSIQCLDGKLLKGKNGKEIFFPAMGLKDSNDNKYDGSNGFMWTSSLYEPNPHFAHILYFDKDDIENIFIGYTGRCEGLPIRPVLI